jgi:hypothetical protein
MSINDEPYPNEDEHPITHQELHTEGLDIEEEEEKAMKDHHPTPNRPSGRREP